MENVVVKYLKQREQEKVYENYLSTGDFEIVMIIFKRSGCIYLQAVGENDIGVHCCHVKMVDQRFLGSGKKARANQGRS